VILSNVVRVWLPIDVCRRHYAACDALGLPNADVIQIGRETTNHVHGTVARDVRGLARGAGVTPWTVLVRLHELWERVWQGVV